MANDLKNLLKKYGFSQSESIIYLFLFKSGAATVQEIVDGTKVPRSTVYDILDSFKNAGLVSYLESKPKRKYVIESPHQIKNYIEESYKAKKRNMKDEYEEKLQDFKDTVHKLLSAQDNVRPRVRFYEGIHGVNALRDDMVKSKSDSYYAVFNYDDTQKTLKRGEGVLSNDQAAKLKSIHKGSIYTSSEGDVMKDKDDNSLFTDKAIPAELVIMDDKVITIDHRQDTITVIIDNANIAKTIKTLFELAYKQLKQK